jgi:hypothetical protein
MPESHRGCDLQAPAGVLALPPPPTFVCLPDSIFPQMLVEDMEAFNTSTLEPFVLHSPTKDRSCISTLANKYHTFRLLTPALVVPCTHKKHRHFYRLTRTADKNTKEHLPFHLCVGMSLDCQHSLAAFTPLTR